MSNFLMAQLELLAGKAVLELNAGRVCVKPWHSQRAVRFDIDFGSLMESFVEFKDQLFEFTVTLNL